MASKYESKSWYIYTTEGQVTSKLLLLMFWEMLKLC